MSKSFWIMGIVGLILAVVLPVAGTLLRPKPEPTCSLDGERLDPAFRVRIVDEQGHNHLFCCLACAELWQKHHARDPRAIYVTDEKSGQEVDVHFAYFVRSRVAVPTSIGTRIHAFAQRRDAEKHVAAFGGRLLQQGETPFHRKL